MLLITVIVIKGMRVSIVKAVGHVDTIKRRLPSRKIHEREEHRFSLPSILLALGRGDEWLFRKDDNDRFISRCWRWSAREKVRWIKRQEAVCRKIEDNVYRHSYPSSPTSLYRNVCKCEPATRESAYKALKRRTIRSTKAFVSRPISQINIDRHEHRRS